MSSRVMCRYKGETLTIGALAARFRREGKKNPYQEAKRYITETKI